MAGCIGLGRVGSKFFRLFGWVSQLMGWVGLGRTKWTHGQLCADTENRVLVRRLELRSVCYKTYTNTLAMAVPEI